MQVFKKACFLFLVLIFAGCNKTLPNHSDRIFIRSHFEQNDATPQFSLANTESFKTAMLLPLSGKASVYGQGMKNAALMAVEDADNPNLVIQFYDTKSSAAGAAEAARQAARDGSQLILGPLMSEEVEAVSRIARSDDIPVISYSTSPNVLGRGVYTLGLLGSEQINRVISYAAQSGRKKIAVLTPDTTAGINTAKAAINAATKTDAEIVKIGFYPPETLDFANIVKSMTDYENRSAEVNKQKELLSARAKAGDKDAERELKKMKTVYLQGDLDFDAILIAESGNRLKSAASMFSYYDISYPDVLFLGTSVWENTGLHKETTLYHSVYPVISRVQIEYFNKKYENLFGQIPNPLYSFAYDSVALASALSRKNPRDLSENITDPDGFIGINGTFRIFEDGTNQHSLDIVEVTANGSKVKSAASRKFDLPAYQNAYYYDVPFNLPQIYGKNQAQAYRELGL